MQQLKQFFSNKRINILTLKKYLKNKEQLNIELKSIYQKYQDRFQFFYFVKFYLLNILDKKCLGCGNLLTQKQINDQNNFCSLKCMSNSDLIKNKIQKTISQKQFDYKQNILQKRKKTNLQKYGCQFHTQSSVVKQKIKNTNLMHCGHSTNLKSKSTKQKIKQTNLQKYGNEVASKSEIVKNKQVETNLQKYGVQNPFLSKQIQNKCLRSNLDKIIIKNIQLWKNYIVPMFDSNEYTGYKNIYKWKCCKCGNQFCSHIYKTNHILEFPYLPRCFNCYPLIKGFSNLENEVVDYIRTFSTNFICNYKQIIKPYQIDIYVPQKKLGIEFDGLIWHSNKFKKDDLNLLHKTELCQSKGIKLIHVFEDEWIYNRQFVQKMIKLNFEQNFDIFKYAQFEDNQYIFDRRYFSKLDFKNHNISYIEPQKFYIKNNTRIKENLNDLFYIYDCGKIILK